MVFFILCAVAGVPLSWHKTAGGDTVSWIGFELLHTSRRLGISERRAAWFVRCTKEVADSEHVHVTKFEEGLGRIMYVAGALDYERPFLGPLYRFLALHSGTQSDACRASWLSSSTISRRRSAGRGIVGSESRRASERHTHWHRRILEAPRWL